MSIIKQMRVIWGNLKRERRIQVLAALCITLLSGIAEICSLGAVIPFLAILTNGAKAKGSETIKEIATVVGISEDSKLVVPSAVIFGAAAVIAASVRVLNIYLNNRLAAAIGSDLSSEAFKKTLYQPYDQHVKSNSAEVIAAITADISLAESGISSVLQMISSVIISVFIISGLIAIDGATAITTGALFGIAYCSLTAITKKRLLINGKEISRATRYQLKSLQEGLGGIREVILEGTQLLLIEEYEKADRKKRRLQANTIFLSTFPRYVLEAVTMVAIASIAVAIVLIQGKGSSTIIILGALALGSQRLLPPLQQVYSAWASLKSYNIAISNVIMLVSQPMPIHTGKSEIEFPRFRRLQLEEVNFRYDSDEEYILKDIELEIKQGECIGVVGSTGSGKSTLMDLVMGLLKPTSGRIIAGDIDLTDVRNEKARNSWRSIVAHVPQDVYLRDASIAENIAFGIPVEKIDIRRVKNAARLARIDRFIESDKKTYWKEVGERGVRLSGGQKQRLGIARALYKDARLLIIDEATSALDANTEREIMESIYNLRGSITTLIIAHREGTLWGCDRIIKVENGTVIELK